LEGDNGGIGGQKAFPGFKKQNIVTNEKGKNEGAITKEREKKNVERGAG